MSRNWRRRWRHLWQRQNLVALGVLLPEYLTKSVNGKGHFEAAVVRNSGLESWRYGNCFFNQNVLAQANISEFSRHLNRRRDLSRPHRGRGYSSLL